MDGRHPPGHGPRPRSQTAEEVERLRHELARLAALERWDRQVLEAVLHESPHGVIVCDPQRLVVICNRAARRMLGAADSTDVDIGWGHLRLVQPEGTSAIWQDQSVARCLDTRQPVDEEEVLVERLDGTRGHLLATCAPIVGEANELLGAVAVFTDITRFRLQSDRLKLLADASRVYAEAAASGAEVMTKLAELLVPGLAESCTIRVVSEDRTRLEAVATRESNPSLTELLARTVSTPLEIGLGPVGRVAATGVPLLVEKIDKGQLLPSLSAAQREYGEQASISTFLVVPMRSRGEVMGVVSVTRSIRGQPFDPDDQIIVQELADRAAAHWAKARLLEAERRARRDAEHLQSVTAGLAGARSASDVASVIMERGRAATGAFGVMFFSLDAAARRLVVLDRRGYQPRLAQVYDQIPMDADLPVTACVRSGQPIFFGDREQRWTAYPALRGAEQGSDTVAVALLPLVVAGAATGALVFSFATARTFTEGDQAFLRALTAQAALALERARLAEVERRAREHASFLADASRLLTSSIDHDEVLRNLARLAVPSLADWCAIEIVDDASTRQAAVAHVDPDKVQLAWELRERYPPDPDAPRGAHQVIRTGQPELYPSITDELLVAGTRDQEHLRLARSLGLRSAMIVPLKARGRTLGAITLVWAETGARPYTAEDLAFAEEVATRAALAIQNAKLYSDLHAAVRARDDFLATAGHELRTPLAALLMQVEGVQRAAAREGGLAPRFVERLDAAARGGRRLQKLVDQLLDVSRIAAGRLKLEPEPLDLGDLVRDVVARFADVASAAGSEVRVSAREEVLGMWDRLRIDQVVSNLLSNALKYGRARPVEVEVSREGAWGILRVTDHGIGIPEEEHARIFGQFERAVGARDFGGLGLGLWISRQVIEASGGKIDLVSRAGEGATFTVALPLESDEKDAS